MELTVTASSMVSVPAPLSLLPSEPPDPPGIWQALNSPEFRQARKEAIWRDAQRESTIRYGAIRLGQLRAQMAQELQHASTADMPGIVDRYPTQIESVTAEIDQARNADMVAAQTY